MGNYEWGTNNALKVHRGIVKTIDACSLSGIVVEYDLANNHHKTQSIYMTTMIPGVTKMFTSWGASFKVCWPSCKLIFCKKEKESRGKRIIFPTCWLILSHHILMRLGINTAHTTTQGWCNNLNCQLAYGDRFCSGSSSTISYNTICTSTCTSTFSIMWADVSHYFVLRKWLMCTWVCPTNYNASNLAFKQCLLVRKWRISGHEFFTVAIANPQCCLYRAKYTFFHEVDELCA